MTLSLAESLAALPEDQRKSILADLTEEQHKELQWDWHFWARPEQKEPPGDWNTLLILAGRGFGKSFAGSQMIRSWACGKTPLAAGRYSRFALIAETAADARDVMVEGVSGILAVHPPDFRPLYEPSKRRLTWKNGAVGTLFNATEPDQLRGPNFDAAWCLTGDSRIRLATGAERRIDEIRVGDAVQTRGGPRRVIAQAMTKRDAEIWRVSFDDGSWITGTAEHLVWTNEFGWHKLSDLKQGETACSSSICSTAMPRRGFSNQSHLNGVALSGGVIVTAISWTMMGVGFIGSSMKAFGGQFRRASTSTMWTAIIKTITSAISWSCRMVPTCGLPMSGASIQKAIGRGLVRLIERIGPQSQARHVFASDAAWSFSRAVPSPVASVQCTVLMSIEPTDLQGRSSSAKLVELNIIRQGAVSVFAPKPAITKSTTGLAQRRESPAMSLVGSADRYSSPSASTLVSATENVPWRFGRKKVIAVESLCRNEDVYDITVEGGEFFANDTLVHNCDELAKYQYSRDTWDMLQFALRIGDHPRVIVTTTPRPIPIIKELMASPNTVIVRGSTMDNRGNLAPSFLKQIQARYAGTRLGRQELNAEVLDDNPNALWTRDVIERNTIKKEQMPQLGRIVVAIDPSGTKGNDEGDDIGIVVAGRGIDGRLYVMQDATVQASPAQWGALAVKLYHEHRADMIVAERNYGGAMVEHVIRTIDPKVAYKEVTASRGKWIRAEPVAGLYEQNKVRHIGALPQLEDEMCAFGLDGLADGKSPNRMDAMVWAATELMLQETRAVVDRTDWLNWDKPSYPQTSTILACVRYLGTGEPPAITLWGVFVPGDARATAAARVILLYSWTGHVHGPDLAAGLDVMCSLKERSKIEAARIAKLFGLKAIPSYKVGRLLLETDGKPNAVQHELGKVLIEHDISVELVDAKRWGDDIERMSGVQHMFEDKMVYAPMSRRFAMQVVDNVDEFPNAANSGLANTMALALLYMRDTGMLLRSEEHGRMTTEMATFRGRQKGLYAG